MTTTLARLHTSSAVAEKTVAAAMNELYEIGAVLERREFTSAEKEVYGHMVDALRSLRQAREISGSTTA